MRPAFAGWFSCRTVWRTVAGSFAAYQHEVTIQKLCIEFPAVVSFAQDQTFSRNSLGRSVLA